MFRNTDTSGLDLNTLFDALPSPYLLMDRQLTLVGMNDAYLRVTGRTREELLGRNVFEAFPSDPQSLGGRELRASLARVVASGEADELSLLPYDIERAGAPPVTRYWGVTHTPLFDRHGHVEYVLQHTEDITELVELREGRRPGTVRNVLVRAARVEAQNRELSEETERLRGLFEQAPSFMAMLAGPEHVFELANDSYLRLVGGRDVVGQRVAEALPEVVDQGFIRLLDDVRRTGAPFVGKAVPVVLLDDTKSGLSQRYLDFVYQPIRDADGEVAGIFVQGHDVTELKRTEAQLARQSDALRLAQAAGGIGTFEWDMESRMVSGSETLFALYGLEPEPRPVPAARFVNAVHPEDRDRLLGSAAPDELAEMAQRQEYRVPLADGGVRWLARQGEVIRDADGHALRVVGAAYDITERKEAEAQTRLLMQELAHRVKNMLAIVGAITTQTLRSASSLDSAQQVLSQRLAALAQAQDSLMQGSWSRARIHEVVGGAARLLGRETGRLSVSGPDTVLDPKAVLGLALLLHELGMNALKYGALSIPDGRVELSWARETDAEGEKLRLTWREQGGPPVAPPSRKGFGSRLIERGLSANLGGEVKLDYRPEGLVCEAEVRLPPVERGWRRQSTLTSA